MLYVLIAPFPKPYANAMEREIVVIIIVRPFFRNRLRKKLTSNNLFLTQLLRFQGLVAPNWNILLHICTLCAGGRVNLNFLVPV